MKIFKIIKTIILLLLILILINVCYLKYIKKEPLIKLFGKSFLIVASGSMEPTIEKEELILISQKEKYQKGDIVTFIDKDGFIITHRVTEIDSNYFITKGDANNINDDKCEIKAIKGKVIFHSKILGKFILYWLKPTVFVYVVTILILDVLKSKRRKEINET